MGKRSILFLLIGLLLISFSFAQSEGSSYPFQFGIKRVGGFPVIRPCEQGIGQCILFVFDTGLRILYTLSLALGTLLLMWAGILYITKPAEAKNIHSRVQWGVIGIIVGMTSFTLVFVLEKWVAGGIYTTQEEISQLNPEIPAEPTQVSETQPQPSLGGSSPTPTPAQTATPTLIIGSQTTATPTLIIDSQTAKIHEDGRFSVFVYIYPENGNCNLNYGFFNLTSGENLNSGSITVNSSTVISYKLPSRPQSGDRIRVTFSSRCNLNIKQLDLTYTPPKAPTTQEIPTITFNIQGIYASQYIRVEIPDNLKDALEELLGVTVFQRNIYQPPFNMYINYEVKIDNNPPNTYGSCILYGVMRGTSVSNFSADKRKAATLYIFNRDFTIILNYNPGKINYTVSRYISPPANTIGFLYIKFYDYEGNCKISRIPFEQVYDIETGKIYGPQNKKGWEAIKEILGL